LAEEQFDAGLLPDGDPEFIVFTAIGTVVPGIVAMLRTMDPFVGALTPLM
jgi:hypothetical protein